MAEKKELPHGLSRYVHRGCRCDICRAAVRERARKYRIRERKKT